MEWQMICPIGTEWCGHCPQVFIVQRFIIALSDKIYKSAFYIAEFIFLFSAVRNLNVS